MSTLEFVVGISINDFMAYSYSVFQFSWFQTIPIIAD